MGQRIMQIIHKCSVCETTPEDGEFMYHINSEIWCKDCCDESDNETDEQRFRRLKKLDL